MDFFILLSSTAGVIGSRGQSNYAAGDTFQDALARYRVSIGEKATSIDLGLVLTVGYAAERGSITKTMQNLGLEGISEAEIHWLLEYWCDPRRAIAEVDECQVVLDVVTPASLRQRGLEEPYWMKYPCSQPLYRMNSEIAAVTTVPSKSKIDLSIELRSAANQAEAEKLSKSLAIPSSDINSAKPNYSFGVDSLVAVELRYWFSKEVKIDVRVMNIMSNDTMADLCYTVAGRNRYHQSKSPE